MHLVKPSNKCSRPAQLNCTRACVLVDPQTLRQLLQMLLLSMTLHNAQANFQANRYEHHAHTGLRIEVMNAPCNLLLCITTVAQEQRR